MAINIDIEENRRITRELLSSNVPIERKDPSWLGNGGKGGILDYELLKGASLEELVELSGRKPSTVRAHFQHLKKVQGLEVINKNGIYKLEVPNSNENMTISDSLFSNVTLEHIDKALLDFENKGIPLGLGSSKYYDIKIGDTLYPPKPIMAYANYYATGREPGNYFSGGENTPCFNAFERLGIEIIPKTNEIKMENENSIIIDLIERYKKCIQENRLTDEVYKWIFVQENYGRPDIKKEDFYKEVKSIKFGNLMYAMGIATINFMAREKPEALRQEFKNLFDEQVPLNERIQKWEAGIETLYRSIDGKHSHHQDERSLSIYLTLQFPQKYTFYKSGYYKRYCELINIKQKGKGEKFQHYLELVNSLIENYISKDLELIEQVKSYIPNYYDGSNHFLLAQDILYQMLGNKFLDEDISVVLEQFISQAQTANLKTKEFPNSYKGLKMKVSFGQGVPARVPWISFLNDPNTTSDGIYPVYLFYKDLNKLILAYGISETNIPSVNWDLKNSKTISEYFEENHLVKPDRYGASYVYRVYDLNELPDSQNLNEDLDQLIEFYLNIKNTDRLEITNYKMFSRKDFFTSLDDSGLIFNPILITRFISSLVTKPFVILSGLSGSGKTKMAQAFVKWICQEESQYRIIPVGADWTNREPLLGYPNALNPGEYVKPDNGVLDLIIQANNQPQLPHFLILDEMNLSHVERYFADFLSVMESKEDISLLAKSDDKNGVFAKLKVPSNLFIIGTVNIDETTNMFSPKVLDRANTIEFRVTHDEMKNFLGNIKNINMDALLGKGAGMAQSFLDMAANKAFSTTDNDAINETLVRFFGELKKTGAEFGYRSATEILRLIHQLSLLDNNLTTDQKIDIAIMQKLLPKLHGSRRKLCPVLETLGSFCIVEKVRIIKDVFEQGDYDFNASKVLYPLSLEKIARMYRGAIDNGFASFAEA